MNRNGKSMTRAAAAAAALLALLAAPAAFAQMTPLGSWNSIDEKSGAPKARMRIVEGADGALSGRIEKLLRPGAQLDAVCDKCGDDRKDQPLLGLEIIRGAKKTPGENAWEGGRILDPENGSTYKLRLTPIEDGKKLEVRGALGPFSRTQTWVRAD